MRREPVTALQIVTSGLLTALLAIAVNVATGGDLPAPLDPFGWFAWPAVGLLAVALTALSVWQHRRTAETPHRAVPAQLPAGHRIHGRAGELGAIRGARARTRVIVIFGAPGAGKTALAVRAAHDLRQHYPDGQLYAELRGEGAVVTPDSVLPAFLRALGEPDTPAPLDELANRFRTAVAHRRLLIVLDDALEDDQVRPLLPGGDGCLVLISSRRALSVGHAVRLGGISADAARELLGATAGRDRIAADPGGTDRIIEACAGLPLAVRLAAARLRDRPGWTPGDLADRLASGRLQEFQHGDAAVRATFRSAYDGLSATDRLVFRRAGAHPGPAFGVGAAAALAGLDEETVAGALDRLTDAMLVDSPAPGRYRLHDLLRLYARELSDDDAALERLLAWLTATAAPGAWRELELENALAALSPAVEHGHLTAAWQLVEAVHPLLDRSADHVYRLQLWQAGEVAARGLGDGSRRAHALHWIAFGWAADAAGRHADAEREFRRMLQLHQGMGHLTGVAGAHRNLGVVAHRRGRHRRALAEFATALEIFDRLGDTERAARCRQERAAVLDDLGRTAEADADRQAAG
ncbi:ATP-binding protein [Catenuloplanes sp. NPDC051500]|uniref:ATP-binding protein n=1 Tax=Catenuloplanes sp. NPDC051500 TaxID=3363959 RepID=UPI00378F6F97